MNNISKIKVNGVTYALDVLIDNQPVKNVVANLQQLLETEIARATAAEGVLQALYQALDGGDITVVSSLPATGTENTIYRVTGQDSYSDYMYYNDNWVLLATYNGQPYTFVHLTQEQYDALTELEKNNGTYYFVEEE